MTVLASGSAPRRGTDASAATFVDVDVSVLEIEELAHRSDGSGPNGARWCAHCGHPAPAHAAPSGRRGSVAPDRDVHRTRILLVEAHAAVRESLAYLLDRQPDIAVVGEAGSLAEARPLLGDVDVLVVDLDLGDGDGADLIGELRAASPRAAVLVLTGRVDPAGLARAVEAGAAGVLHKSVPVAAVIDAVRRLCGGELLLSTREVVELLGVARRQRAQEQAARDAAARLTPREREVLAMLARGLGDKEIAERLHVSKDTVHTHMANLLAKLGAESRLQALILAVRHGVVSIE